ncbi:MAG TPA: acyl-CoA dehydrogenase family protein, partial [Methylomirabilota bacterium]|nr:acyl-CoA dehydrogenase family protein [Methylomirabilota bacterium]
MDFALSPEQALVVDTVRGFVERELYPLEAEVERTGEVRPDVAATIRDKVIALGFYAPNIPAIHGGGGLDRVTETLLERELGRASMALTHFWHRPSAILCAGTPDQIARFLLPSVRGERMDCLAITEPGAGSDVRAMKTRARRDGDGWILDGVKHFISHADVADFAIVFAATGEEDTPRGRRPLLTGFLVEKGAPGFEVRPGYRSV